MIDYFLKNKETIQNFLWRAVQIFGKQGVTFLIFIVCAKILDTHSFGIYNYILAFVYLLVVFSDFGISLATSKSIAESNVSNRRNEVGKILFNSFLLIFLFNIIIIVILVIFGPRFLNEYYRYVSYIIPLIFLIPLISLYDGVYRGLKKFKQLSTVTILNGLFSLLYVYILVNNFGLVGALSAQILFYSILLASLFVGHLEFSVKYDREIVKKILSYSLLIGISNIGYLLYTKIDVLVLGQYGLIDEIAYYEIINKIFMLMLLPVTILGTVVAPNTTKNFILKRYSYIYQKLFKEVVGLFLFGVALSIIVQILLPLILKIFFHNYDIGLLQILLRTMLILIPFRYFSSYMIVGYITPSGNIKTVAWMMLFFGSINALLDYCFIERFEFIGVIYASLLAQFSFIILSTSHFLLKLRKLMIRTQ